MDYEAGSANLDSIVEEIKGYGQKLSEADTRCKIVDQILVKCLGWNERDIFREEHINNGYIDYVLRADSKGLIVEAKKSHPLFELPAGVDYSSNVTIGGLLKKSNELATHYEQVLKYCLNAGIQFGAFTNGLEWVIFAATRSDGINISRSRVVIFRGIEEIRANFVSFWNLFSRAAIQMEETNRRLLPEVRPIPVAYKVNSGDRHNEILNRNPLSGILAPVLPQYFGDLIGPELVPKLAQCYVESDPLSKWDCADTKLSKTVGENPPIPQPRSVEKAYEYLDRSIRSYSRNEGRTGVLNIVLGRVGSGKSTFLNYYFYVKNKSVSESNLVYLLNMLEYDGQQGLSDFFFEKIYELSQHSKLFLENSGYEVLEKAFQNDIVGLVKGPLGGIDDPQVIRTETAKLLVQLTNNRPTYFAGLFGYLKRKKGICTILVFDNIDQLDPDLQEQIVKFAFTIYQEWGSFTVISMREENYIKSKMEGSLSTIQCNQFALPRPSIVPIIERRLKCLSDDIASGKCEIPCDLSAAGITSLDLSSFIVQISNSLVSSRDRVRNFLEAIALGNIRESLEFFRNFLAAGNTNSGKILDITKKFGSYTVPDHEFVKSISLGSRMYFSESHSPVLNLYSVSDMESPSHFTKLRVLHCLSRFQYQARPYGTGFESIDRLKKLMMSVGVSELDVKMSLSSLTKKRLIENDLHTVKYLDKANAVRITPAGTYYIKYLLSQFAYLDLMQQELLGRIDTIHTAGSEL